MIIGGVRILTECSECKRGFDTETDYEDMKNEDDHIISWCRKCQDKCEIEHLMLKGFDRKNARRMLKEAISLCSETVDYNTAIEKVISNKGV